jgi:hypothetical protein
MTDALAEAHHPWAGGLKRFESGLRGALSADRVAALGGPDGQIDFENERSLYIQGKSNWKLHAPGRTYIGEPGEWYAYEPNGLDEDDPFWLLAILEGTAEAAAQGDETVLGTTCHLHTAWADFNLATTNAGRQIDPPSPGDELDLSALPIEVWLDDSGRIRRALLHGPRRSLTQLELSHFSEPDPIVLPPSDEISPA